MKTTVFSDEHIAAIWLCDKMVTNRNSILNGVEKRVGETPEILRRLIVEEEDLFMVQEKSIRNTENRAIVAFALKIMKGELGPEDSKVQKVASVAFREEIKNHFHFHKGMRQELGNKVKYFNQLGYNITFDQAKDFLKRTLKSVVDEIYN